MSTSGVTKAEIEWLLHQKKRKEELERILKTLFQKAMGGDWEEVIKLYEAYPDILCAKITKSGNTAVNIAVLDGQNEVVEKLVALMKMNGDPHASEALGTENDRGNTPLHYAAAMGNVRMCSCIAEVDSRLIGRRNHDGETPFFLEVLNGEKSAFLCLHSICRREPGLAYTYCRRSDGDTILHCAITGEYFDLAYQIIHLYPLLVNRVNNQGFSPLQILAGMPSAFRSGSRVEGFNKLIYRCSLIMKMEERKQKHVWSKQVLDELLKLTSAYEYEDDGRHPQQTSVFGQDGTTPYSFKDGGDVTFSASVIFTSPPQLDDDETITQENGERRRMWESSKETAILIAAKNGIVEMVDGILQRFPVAVHDLNYEKKNIFLLAVENRQLDVYRLLLKNNNMKDAIFRQVDNDENTAMHLAAKLQEHKPWVMPGPALEMQREIKWYEFVRNTIPKSVNIRPNKEGKSPEEIFTATHKELVKSSGEWMTRVSESCSSVAGLIAAAAFATSTAVPGGVRSEGTPNLQDEPAFYIFAMASLIALCSSFAALAIFLTIRASGFQESDFRTNLPFKLLVGLTSLALSAISVSVSFCTGHFFIIKHKLKYAALPTYAVTLAVVLVVILSTTRFSVLYHLVRASWRTTLLKSSPHQKASLYNEE